MFWFYPILTLVLISGSKHSRFERAIEMQDWDEVEQLLLQPYIRCEINPSYDDQYPLRKASINGAGKVVRLLLKDKRARPCKNNCEAFRQALERRHIDVIRAFLEDGRVPEELVYEAGIPEFAMIPFEILEESSCHAPLSHFTVNFDYSVLKPWHIELLLKRCNNNNIKRSLFLNGLIANSRFRELRTLRFIQIISDCDISSLQDLSRIFIRASYITRIFQQLHPDIVLEVLALDFVNQGYMYLEDIPTHSKIISLFGNYRSVELLLSVIFVANLDFATAVPVTILFGLHFYTFHLIDQKK